MKNLALILAVISILLSGFALIKSVPNLGSALKGLPTVFTGLWVQDSDGASTIQAGKASSGGCLILGDSSAGANVVYITASGATITATTTSVPTVCKTASTNL